VVVSEGHAPVVAVLLLIPSLGVPRGPATDQLSSPGGTAWNPIGASNGAWKLPFSRGFAEAPPTSLFRHRTTLICLFCLASRSPRGPGAAAFRIAEALSSAAGQGHLSGWIGACDGALEVLS
jgi:hypothetical protein